MKQLRIVVLLALAACFPKNQKPEGGNKGGKWPKKWNAEMEVSIGENGGMLPEWWEMTVAGDSAVYKHSYNQNETVVRVKLSQTDLDSIAAAIRKSKPHKVEMREHEVIYDKGTSFARVRHGQRIITLAEGATESFTKDGWKDFSRIFSTVFRIVSRNTEKEKIKLTLTVKCTGSKNYWCQIQHNDRGSRLFGCADTARTQTINIFPGQHGFYAYIFQSENGQYKYPQKNWPFNHVSLRINKDTILNFTLKDSVLELRK